MPTLALTIILAVMPILLKIIAAKIEMQPSLSAVDFSVGQKYFIFQFFVVFIFNTIIGAASTGTSSGDSKLPIIDIGKELKDDPSLITDWLGQAIPQQVQLPCLYDRLSSRTPLSQEPEHCAPVDVRSRGPRRWVWLLDALAICNSSVTAGPPATCHPPPRAAAASAPPHLLPRAVQAAYFLSFLLTKGVFAASIRFLRAPGAIIYWILGKISSSERAKKRTWSRQYASYGTSIPSDSMAFLILIVFSVSQPFVSGAALVYFACSHFYWRYDLLYTKREAYQSGGVFWPVVRTCSHPHLRLPL